MSRSKNNFVQTQQRNMQITQVVRSSALPPPEELERYEQMNPGTTKLLLDTYKKQVDHRIDIERTAVTEGLKSASRGQVLSFILSFTAIVGGVILILSDKNVFGLVSIVTALVALVGIYIGGTISKKNERIQKSRQNPE